MRNLPPLVLVVILLLLTGCSTLKGWFTPEGKTMAQAQALADQGHPLGASALAVEALVIDPQYREALVLLFDSFEAGQEEFRTRVESASPSSDPARRDDLVKVYRWQKILADRGPGLGTLVDPRTKDGPTPTVLEIRLDSVDEALAQASQQASLYHWDLARDLAGKGPGPRQARVALAEGRVARDYASTPALEAWLKTTEEAATQRVLVIPFFTEVPWDLGPVSGPLASKVSRAMMESRDLPELTTVFPSDRIATLPGGALARLGIVSQPEAFELARAAGQNLVLLGQITRLTYQEPRKSVRTSLREKTVTVVDPDHPGGMAVTWRATVTTTVWTTSARVGASFSVVEVDTGHDLVTSTREAYHKDEVVLTSYSGQRDALTSEDLAAISDKDWFADPEALGHRVLDDLARQVAEDVVRGLGP